MRADKPERNDGENRDVAADDQAGAELDVIDARPGAEAIGAVNTIPASLRRAALAIAKYDLFSRIAVLRTLAEGAKNDAEKAERMLERVEEGKVKIEAPAEADETETGKRDG